MANRYHDTTRWSDSWYKTLKPKFKCAWDYMCDNCKGSGEWRFDLELLSIRVGEPITLDEFKTVFKDRVYFLSDDRAWLPGSTPFHQKNPTAKNRIQRALMEKYISLAAQVSNLDPKWSRQAETYKCILMNLAPAPTRVPDGARTGPVRDSIEDRVLSIEDRVDLKEGAESKPIEEFDAASLGDAYPNPVNVAHGVAKLRDQILTRSDFDSCMKAIGIYERLCKQERRKFRDFDKWVDNDWRQWLKFEARIKAKSSGPPTYIPEVDRSQESLTLEQIQAMKKAQGL